MLALAIRCSVRGVDARPELSISGIGAGGDLDGVTVSVFLLLLSGSAVGEDVIPPALPADCAMSDV